MENSSTILIAVVVLVVLGLAAWAVWRAQRRRALAQKYGPEYERLAADKGDAERAVRELEERERRVSAFKLRELTPAQREHHLAQWNRVQTAFVDSPEQATRDAHALLMDVMRDRGYPDAELDQRQRDLSVNYPSLIEPYREACAIAARRDGTSASTEDLRRATIVYRSLFEALLDDRKGKPSTNRREVA